MTKLAKAPGEEGGPGTPPGGVPQGHFTPSPEVWDTGTSASRLGAWDFVGVSPVGVPCLVHGQVADPEGKPVFHTHCNACTNHLGTGSPT